MMLKLALNVALPGIGIVLAALVQVAFTALWPQLQSPSFGLISIDSYLVVLVTLGLCFVAGGLAQRNIPAFEGAVCAVIVPLAWLGLLLRVVTMGAGSIAWLRPMTLLTIFAALAPLIGVALGWMVSRASSGGSERIDRLSAVAH